jgi:YVTN family beta-propeller protein
LAAITLLLPTTAIAPAPSSTAQGALATIPLGSGGIQPISVAVNTRTNRVYAATVVSKSVTVIDALSGLAIAGVPLSAAPRAVAANPTTNRVYATLADNSVAVIDGSSNTLRFQVALGAVSSVNAIGARGIAVNPETNRVYAASGSSNIVAVIDGTTDSVVASISMAPSISAFPSYVAVNSVTNRVYVTSGNDLLVIDGATNTIIARVPVATVSNVACLFTGSLSVNPVTNRVYVGSICLSPGAATQAEPEPSPPTPPTSLPFPTPTPPRPPTPFLFPTPPPPPPPPPFGIRPGLVIVDGQTNLVAGSVQAASFNNPTGVAVNPSTNRVYLASGDDIVVIDGASSAIVATVPAISSPRGGMSFSYGYTNRVATSPSLNRVFVANQDGNTVSIVDGESNALVANPAVGRVPRDLAINTTTNQVYVASGASHAVFPVDGGSHTVGRAVPVGNPGAVAVDSASNRIYATISATRRLVVVDGAANAVEATLDVVSGIDPFCVGAGLAVNSATRRVYIANACGPGISVVDAITHAVAADVNLRGTPWSVAVDEATDRIYAGVGNAVKVVDGLTYAVIATVDLAEGSGPIDVAVDSAGSRAYVANREAGTVSVIDTRTNRVISTIPAGRGPRGVSVGALSVYVANVEDNSVTVIDRSSNAVVATIPVGQRPVAVEANPRTGRVYVANEGSDSLSVIDEGLSPGAGTPTPTLLPTPAPVRHLPLGFSITSSGAGAVRLRWRSADERASYVLVRWTASGPTASLIPGSQTSRQDTLGPEANFACYLLAALNGSGAVVGWDDLLCVASGLARGSSPGNFTLLLGFPSTLPRSTAALSWSSTPGARAYTLLFFPPLPDPPRLFPASQTSFTVTGPDPQCYLLVALGDNTVLGNTDVLCRVLLLTR